MSKRLISLFNVPEDELEEICQMLDRMGLQYYESRPGLFGLTPGAIWLVNAEDYESARSALDQYQQSRAIKARDEWQERVREGRTGGFWFSLKSNPFGMLLALVIIVLALAMSLLPFMWLG